MTDSGLPRKFITLLRPEQMVDADLLLQKLIQLDPKIIDRLDTVKVGNEYKIGMDKIQSFFAEVEATLETHNQAVHDLRLQKERVKMIEAEYEERFSDDERSKKVYKEEIENIKRELAKKTLIEYRSDIWPWMII